MDAADTPPAPVSEARKSGAGRRGAEPMLLFIARPSAAVRTSLEHALLDHRVSQTLGAEAFAPGNWHQSVSDRHADTPENRRRMSNAGERVSAEAFTLEFDRVSSGRNPRGTFNWQVHPRSSKSSELKALVDAVNGGLLAEGLPMGGGHTPHLTLSYRASQALPRMLPIAPVAWTIDAFEMVLRGGEPFHYRTLARWALAAEAPRAIQGSMF